MCTNPNPNPDPSSNSNFNPILIHMRKFKKHNPNHSLNRNPNWFLNQFQWCTRNTTWRGHIREVPKFSMDPIRRMDVGTIMAWHLGKSDGSNDQSWSTLYKKYMETFLCPNEKRQLPNKTLNKLEAEEHQQKCNVFQWYVYDHEVTIGKRCKWCNHHNQNSGTYLK